MRRREFVTLLGASVTVWPVVGRAQQAVSKIGVLWPGSVYPPPPRMPAFTQALRQLGFIEGQNLSIELRYARGGVQQLSELAAELAQTNVDVIAAFGDLAPKIAHDKTKTIPIVAISDDILATGLVESLSHPGGSTTGLSIMSSELSAKRLGVLHDMIPQLSYVIALWDPTTGASQIVATQNAANTLGVELEVCEIRHRDDLTGAFDKARTSGADGINVFASPSLSSLFREIIDLSMSYRIPASYQWKEHVRQGACFRTARTWQLYGGKREPLWSKYSTVPGRLISPSSNRRSSNWQSTPGPRRRWTFLCSR